MRKIRIYVCLALTLLLLISTLTPAMAGNKGTIKHLFPPDTAKGKGTVKDFSPPALEKGKAQGVFNHRLYDPAVPGDEVGGFPGCGSGVVTVDRATGETVGVFPGQGDGVSIIGADGTIIFVFPGKTNADGTIRPIYRQKCFTSHF